MSHSCARELFYLMFSDKPFAWTNGDLFYSHIVRLQSVNKAQFWDNNELGINTQKWLLFYIQYYIYFIPGTYQCGYSSNVHVVLIVIHWFFGLILISFGLELLRKFRHVCCWICRNTDGCNCSNAFVWSDIYETGMGLGVLYIW